MSRLLLACVLALTCSHVLRADPTGTNILAGDFESGQSTYNPWAGVDDQGILHVLPGSQLAVSDSGRIGNEAFSPSVAVADLNGDGLPDLVVADARGFFWYFPNSGKPDAPAFTHGEVMPVWLGGGFGEGDAVPFIQLVDYGAEKKFDIVAGNYLGGLYFLHNLGSAALPHFHMPSTRDETQIATHKGNALWCNYLSPFLYDWTGTGRLDLVIGDGSYSANSIYLFTNMGGNDRPVFNEDHSQKIIAGMGREHLTPQVVDWNGDGKPDIIAGERTGCIDLYLNQNAGKTSPPSFDADHPQHIMFGTTDKIGALTTVCAADLNHDNLFDLVVSSTDGRISYAQNIGTAGAPKFGPLVPLKGTNPFPGIVLPRNWIIDRYRPDGAPYELLECTNADIEKGFTPPPNFKGRSALKFSIVPVQNVYFKDFYEPEDMTRSFYYKTPVTLVPETHYIFSAWVRTDGNISELTYKLEGDQTIGPMDFSHHVYIGPPMGGGSTWTLVKQDIILPSAFPNKTAGQKEIGGFNFALLFKGTGTLYMDDFSLRAAN